MFGYRSLGFGAFPNRDVDFTATNSARFVAADNNYLEKIPSAATNRRTWTFSCWIKRGVLGSDQFIFNGGSDASNFTSVNFTSSDTLRYEHQDGGSRTDAIVTNRVFRDTHAWYHIVVAIDTTDSTEADRVKIYVNGTQETSLGTSNYPALNMDTDVNIADEQRFGSRVTDGADDFDGYIAQAVLVDGTALAPSNFGKFDTVGRWQPINPLLQGITFGNNGFFLPFTETNIGHDATGSSTAATLNFVGFTASGSSGSTLEDYTANTYSSVSVGSNENSSRIILVAAVTTGGGSGTDGVSGITCGGTSGTKVFENLGTDHQQIAVFRFDGISSGTTKDIEVTYQRSTKRGGIYVYDGTGLSLNPNTFVNTLSSSSTAITSDFDIQAGSAALAITIHANGEDRNTLTHTNLTEDNDVGLGPDAGSPTGSGTQTGSGSATFANAVAAQTLTVTPSGTVPLRSTAFLVFGPENANNFQPK